jgi:hypothetical protein
LRRRLQGSQDFGVGYLPPAVFESPGDVHSHDSRLVTSVWDLQLTFPGIDIQVEGSWFKCIKTHLTENDGLGHKSKDICPR